MIKEKMIQYKKAYTELNEIFKVLSSDQKDKIPLVFINNVKNNMDTNYEFKYDISKEIFEQDLMIETKALLIEIYERYLAPSEEEELWQKYDRFCLDKIENEKREKYNIDIFRDKNTINKPNLVIRNENSLNEKNNNNIPVEYKKQKIFNKIVNFIKGLFCKK